MSIQSESSSLTLTEKFRKHMHESGMSEEKQTEVLTQSVMINILDSGILSSSSLERGGKRPRRGYDFDSSENVFLNLITKEDGIAHSIFNPADGIFGVGVEKANDYEWIQQIRDLGDIERIVEEEIVELKDKIKLEEPAIVQFKPRIEEKALGTHLAKNDIFLQELCNRVNKIVVFVLDVEIQKSDKLDDPKGCHDAVRPMIPAKNIIFVVASSELKDAVEVQFIQTINNVVFVASKKQEISYTYAFEEAKKTFKITIDAPDFETGLKQIWQQHFSSERPMFLHAARC